MRRLALAATVIAGYVVGVRPRLLLGRTRSTGSPAWFRLLTNTAVWEPAHAVMQLRQFANLRRRVERPSAPTATAP